MKHLVGYVLPAFLICLAVPMVLGVVPPNRFYGFRTPKTLSSPGIWYPANRVSGWCLIAGGALAIGINLALWLTHPDWPAKNLQLWMTNTTPAMLLFSVIASFYYLRKL